MALLMGGLALAVTSCKDDDDDNNGENTEQTGTADEDMEQLESTGNGLTASEMQLSSLICRFTGMQSKDLLAQPDWKSKTYEALLGTVLNESRPTVRAIGVGTAEAADEQASILLYQLGISNTSPAGFTYSSE
jgi:hypothetical protein